MLEKLRIHRAMLKLNETGGFSARDLAASTAAALPTIRKTIERAVADGLIEECSSRPSSGRGGPQKLFRMTEMGVAGLGDTLARIYAALVAEPLSPAAAVVRNAPLPDGISFVVADDAECWLDAALETLGALRGPSYERRKLLERLALAAEELDEAAGEKGEIGLRALELGQVVRNVTQQAHGLAEDDEAGVQSLCNQLLAYVEKAA